METIKNFEPADLQILQSLIGKKLNSIFKQLDMFILNFGEEIEYSLHAFCFLRVCKQNEILLTYCDEYILPNYAFMSKKAYKKDELHEKSLLKVSIEKVKLLLENAVVVKVIVSETADITILFDNEVVIEIMVDCLYEHNEFYRFFKCNSPYEPHYVIKSLNGKIVTEQVMLDEKTCNLLKSKQYEKLQLKKNKDCF